LCKRGRLMLSKDPEGPSHYREAAVARKARNLEVVGYGSCVHNGLPCPFAGTAYVKKMATIGGKPALRCGREERVVTAEAAARCPVSLSKRRE